MISRGRRAPRSRYRRAVIAEVLIFGWSTNGTAGPPFLPLQPDFLSRSGNFPAGLRVVSRGRRGMRTWPGKIASGTSRITMRPRNRATRKAKASCATSAVRNSPPTRNAHSGQTRTDRAGLVRLLATRELREIDHACRHHRDFGRPRIPARRRGRLRLFRTERAWPADVGTGLCSADPRLGLLAGHRDRIDGAALLQPSQGI